ncbi:hypothetical protein [Paenibacillus physcomitrellae]|uniref:hypothetical protein n=1 Tax=Paenibacillus physcomitrellae TaxID=1619311 RepID=UPI0012FD5702|nr:hypothetical protein [Paenibacillus physcomitrellae]
MKRKTYIAALLLALVIAAWAGGYWNHTWVSHSSSGEHTGDTAAFTWLSADKPPLPEVLINGQKLQIRRESYSWCQSISSLSDRSCVSADSAALFETAGPSGLKTAVAQPNSPIQIQAPKQINNLSIQRLDPRSGQLAEDSSYTTPAQAGTYYYLIHCEWLADQGNADFSFGVEIKDSST